MLLLRRRRLKVKLRRCFNLVPATALATSLRLEVEVESVEQGFMVYQGQQVHATMSATPQPPAMRPRVGARRGQATDPHSIAERLRRERIAERIGALQELVPSVNKTDRAAMLDEIVDYVKFLHLQVKVLSMSRLGGGGAVAPLGVDIRPSSVEEEGSEGGRNRPEREKSSNVGTERQVAKLSCNAVP